jgi:hypothetical protein
MAKRKSKDPTEKHVQDLKASIADKSGTHAALLIENDELRACNVDQVERLRRFTFDLMNTAEQMGRLLDQHLPDWRERVTFPDTPPPPRGSQP